MLNTMNQIRVNITISFSNNIIMNLIDGYLLKLRKKILTRTFGFHILWLIRAFNIVLLLLYIRCDSEYNQMKNDDGYIYRRF